MGCTIGIRGASDSDMLYPTVPGIDNGPYRLRGFVPVTVSRRRAIALCFLYTCLAAWFCLASAADASDQDAAGVSVASSALENATRYTITRGDCSITWTAYSSELNKGVVKHSSQCPGPLSSQLPILTEICRGFLGRDMNAAAFRTLFWGGLVPEREPLSLEMPLRLALAAYRSPEWDAKKGRPRNGDINRFVKNLANRELIYPELKELFARFQRSITLASVEKVRVLEAKKLPFYDHLRQQGVQAEDKLPFDAMVWFSVSPAPPDQNE